MSRTVAHHSLPGWPAASFDDRFSLETLGVLVHRHRADDTVTRAIARILRADLVVVDLCRLGDYADLVAVGVVDGQVRAEIRGWHRALGAA